MNVRGEGGLVEGCVAAGRACLYLSVFSNFFEFVQE